MKTFMKKYTLLLLLSFCVFSIQITGERRSVEALAGRTESLKSLRYKYVLKQPDANSSEEWKEIAGKVWVCSGPFTVIGSGNKYYWRFFENEEGEYWLRVIYNIPPSAWGAKKAKPEVAVMLEQIELDKHFIRKVNCKPRGITWGILRDKLIVPAVVRVEPKKWVYSRFTREEDKHEEYCYEFDNELKSGSFGKFKSTYKKKYSRGEPKVIEGGDYRGQYTCTKIKGRKEILVSFSDMIDKANISGNHLNRALYIDLENGVGFFDKGRYLKNIEKGWTLPKQNHPDWQIFHKETETYEPILLKFLSDCEKQTQNCTVETKK